MSPSHLSSTRRGEMVQVYPHGGVVLALLTATYALSFWFALTSSQGNAAIYSLAIAVMGIESLALLVIDWRGFTSLAGLIRWQEISLKRKIAYVTLFVGFFVFAPLVYFWRAIRQHYYATQQSPGQQMQASFARFKSASRRVQGIIVTSIVLAGIAFCSMTGVAIGGSKADTVTTTSAVAQAPNLAPTTQGQTTAAQVQPTATAQPQPTATAKPQPTATPKPKPTATPKPAPPKPTANPCQYVACNPWGYTFNGDKYIYNPASAFCSYFSCISSFWNGQGFVMQCQDGMFSKSGGRSGSCSHHGGNQRPLYGP